MSMEYMFLGELERLHFIQSIEPLIILYVGTFTIYDTIKLLDMMNTYRFSQK